MGSTVDVRPASLSPLPSSAGTSTEQLDAKRRVAAVMAKVSRRPRSSFFSQTLGRDEEWAAGESGERSVRGVAGTGRSERQHLPDPLARGGEPLDEGLRLRPEVADGEAPRQRRGVEEDSAAAD